MKSEAYVFAKLLKIPGQAMRVTDVLNLRKHGRPQFVSLKSYMCASLCRYASKTFRGWQPLLSMLRDSAAEALPMRDVILGVLSPSFWDDPPIVSSFLDAWTHLYTVSLAPRPPTWRQISDIAPLPILDQSVIYQASVEHHFPDDLAGLVVRRLRATFGVSERLTNSLDLDFIFSRPHKFRGHLAMVWFKTITNAWCAGTRMHSAIQLSCVFGCRDHGSVAHYLTCPTLRDVALASLGVRAGTAAPDLLAALSVQPFADRQIIISYLYFTLYHSRRHDFSSTPPYPIPFSDAEFRFAVSTATAALRELQGRFDVQVFFGAPFGVHSRPSS